MIIQSHSIICYLRQDGDVWQLGLVLLWSSCHVMFFNMCKRPQVQRNQTSVIMWAEVKGQRPYFFFKSLTESSSRPEWWIQSNSSCTTETHFHTHQHTSEHSLSVHVCVCVCVYVPLLSSDDMNMTAMSNLLTRVRCLSASSRTEASSCLKHNDHRSVHQCLCS